MSRPALWVPGLAGVPNFGLLSAIPTAGPAVWGMTYYATDERLPYECVETSAGVFSWKPKSTASRGYFAANSSLTGAVDQYISPGSFTVTSTTVDVGFLQQIAGFLADLDVQFQGNAANVAGQTATIRIQVSQDHGVTYGDVPGATTTLATTAGAHYDDVSFTPFAIAEGDVVRAIITPSGVLTAALTNVMVAVR